MLNFPDEINIVGKTLNPEYFENHNNKRLICLFRKEIYDLIIGRDNENDYLDLEIFVRKYNCDINNKNIIKIFETIITELNTFGWKTKLSFGNTGLFIYSSEKEPSSCW